MLDITNSPYLLDKEDGNFSVFEYVFGYRFSIKVDRDTIFFSQDSQFNKKVLGKELDLSIVESLIENKYSIFSKDNLRHTRLPEYTLNCIYYSQELNVKLNKNLLYQDEGIYVVEVVHPNGGLLSSEFLEEFCNEIKLPALPPALIGDLGFLKYKFLELRGNSSISRNGIGNGIVIKHEPSKIDTTTGSIVRFYVSPTVGANQNPDDESPETMAKEFVGVYLTRERIKQLEELSGLNAKLNKTRFINFIIKFIKENNNHELNFYLSRCRKNLSLDEEKNENLFIKLLKLSINEYFLNILFNGNDYFYIGTEKMKKKQAKNKTKTKKIKGNK